MTPNDVVNTLSDSNINKSVQNRGVVSSLLFLCVWNSDHAKRKLQIRYRKIIIKSFLGVFSRAYSHRVEAEAKCQYLCQYLKDFIEFYLYHSH